MADFTFPNFNLPGYPYASLPAQALASMQQPTGLSSYGRFNLTGQSGAPAGGGGLTLPPSWRPGDPLPPGWQPNMQVPAPPMTPGMQVPGLPPGQSPFTPGLPNVAPAGSGGLLGLPAAPNNGQAPAGVNTPAPTGSPPPPATASPGASKPTAQTKAAVVGPPSATDPNFGAIPQLQAGAGGNEFATNAVMNGLLGGQLQKALSYGDGRSKFAQAVLDKSGPASLNPGDFNKAAAVDPRLALTLLGMGGGNYQQAVAAANNWTPAQMNSFINGTFYGPGTQSGLTPQNLALLRSMGIM